MNTPSSLSPAPSDRLQRSVRIAADDEISWFDDLLGQHHYLGAGQPVGDYLRQVVEQDGQPVALLGLERQGTEFKLVWRERMAR